MNRIKKFFISALVGGITVLLPIGILIFIFQFIFNFILDFLSPLSKSLQLNLQLNNVLSNFAAVSIILALCFITGFFVPTKIGELLNKSIGRLFNKIPGYSIIRETIEQFTKNNMKDSFSKVALAEVYSSGSLSTVFVIEKTEDMYTVFVPTGPNPTSGNIFHLHEDRVYIVDVKIDEAMKSIIGVGLGSSKLIESYKQKLIEKSIDSDNTEKKKNIT